MHQLTFDDGAGDPFSDPESWCFATKTPTALEYAQCAWCGRRPASLDPLPPGWSWDTMEPTNPWLFCPNWRNADCEPARP